MAGARFTFIGTLDANKDETSKGYFFREGETKEKKGKDGKKIPGKPYVSVNLQIIQEKNNRGFIEAFGMKSDTIETVDKDAQKISIDWSDRFDDDVVKEVADFRKFTVNIGDKKNKYVSSYDAIKDIVDNIDELKGKTVIVSGQRKKNEYNGKITDRFEFNSIKTVDDEDTVKRMTVNMELLFNKESIDSNDWKDEHKLYINGWTEEYISEIRENRFLDQQIVFDCSKVDWENEKHINQVKFRLRMIGCELDDDNKVVVKLKAKKLWKLGIVTSFVNGQEEVSFDESMLTDLQKEALELGLKTLDDFKPSGSIYGNRVLIYKLKDFNLRDDSPYKDGYIDSELTQDDFDEKYYEPVTEASEDEVVEEKEFSDDDDDDLFS